MASLIITHSGCSDGFAAAWVLKKCFPYALYIPRQHGQLPPNVTGEDVVIADFSYHRDVLLDMKREARSLIVLDHHVTAMAELSGLDFCTFDLERSGAGLAWDYCHPGESRPTLVNYVEDRDLWRRTLPASDAVATVIQSTPFEFEAYEVLATRCDSDFAGVIKEGEVILKAHAAIEDRIGANMVTVTIAGFRVPAVNTAVLQSEMGHLLDHGVPFAVSWFVTAAGRVRFSLRSELDGEDVAGIATSFGGGGHPHAAGFEVDLETALRMFTFRGL